MYEALLKNTPEYQKIAASLASPGPAALFGLPPAGRAALYRLLKACASAECRALLAGADVLWTMHLVKLLLSSAAGHYRSR